MKTDSTTNPNNKMSTSEQQESKETLNRKTSVEFVTSVTIGVVVIILIAATAYFGIIR
jgi:F0F1-type ATP synthase assembly protein I